MEHTSKMQDHQDKSIMENNKTKLIQLISTYTTNKVLIELFKNNDFELKAFSRTKDDFLDVEETRLLNTIELKNEVFGFRQMIENVKNSINKTVVTNLVTKNDREVIIYTDENYSLLYGII